MRVRKTIYNCNNFLREGLDFLTELQGWRYFFAMIVRVHKTSIVHLLRVLSTNTSSW